MADNASGRGIAEEKLIRAAGELLSEVGPRAASVRAVATRAGVNHGLVHHYFGSKESLLRAAMTRLVEDHAAFAKDMAKGASVPAPFARSLHARASTTASFIITSGAKNRCCVPR